MKILIKHLTKLVTQETIEKNKEKIKNQISIIKSLLGVNNEIIGLVANFI
jgi:hypothetical protein